MFKKDTDNYDIGRVDIFLREKKSPGFVFKQITLYGFKARSRFGSTIAKLGDINDDGFNGNNKTLIQSKFSIFDSKFVSNSSLIKKSVYH